VSHTYQLEFETATFAVLQASKLCRAVQQSISSSVLQKDDRSPVTVADFGSQALVCQALREAFPDDQIIAEERAEALLKKENAPLLERVVRHVRAIKPEADADLTCSWIGHGGTDTYADRFWTLDPVDGTKGFLRSEQYAIALALVEGGQVKVAALACPNLPYHTAGADANGSLFWAIQGEGAFSASLGANGEAGPIMASATLQADQARFCESVEAGHSSHDEAASVARLLGITREPIRMDSQAKYALVARGEADIYLRLPTRPGYVEKIWDHAAGALIITEAGGTVTDVDGKALEFSHGALLSANRGVVATNGRLHEHVLESIRAVYAKQA
jgi:3'(2'), 5'-bisphosphate nucleotidase